MGRLCRREGKLSPSRIRSLACAGALIGAAALSWSSPARAQSATETCLAVDQRLSADATLPRTTAALKANGPLKIVAMGSSSTLGLWQSDPAKTYPGMLESELRRLRPDLRLEVVNSGRNADTIPGNIARFDRDVLMHRPDLVIWQIGTNDVTWLQSADSLTGRIVEGIRLLKADRADVILMDQQYAPVILASQYSKMQASIAEAAQQERVPLFSRFELMRRAMDAGLTMGALTAWDGLHNSAAGYECIGRALARAIVTVTQTNMETPPKTVRRRK
ncbi:Lysophospholipase L1 [Bradyrhizobium sp. NFR13]|nr:Lysophospholipase L1 [Bradyrhizobium sp. NFR13]